MSKRLIPQHKLNRPFLILSQETLNTTFPVCDISVVQSTPAPVSRITLCDPGDVRWHRALTRCVSTNLGHAAEWGNAFQKSYGHQPLYWVAEGQDSAIGILPAFLVRRPFVGDVVTSMPFLDTGGPCYTQRDLSNQLVDAMIATARDAGARHVELRCSQPLQAKATPQLDKVRLVLDLPNDPDKLWQRLDAKVRNQVRKAEKSGLRVVSGGKELLAEFYHCFAVNMRDLGSPVHSMRFFEAILECFGKRANVVLVKLGDLAIGGLISIRTQKTITVPWASCLREYFRFCPNMILYWETLRRASEEDIYEFDFGRSTREVGTYRFKRQWGAEERQLYWYDFDIANGTSNPPEKQSGISAQAMVTSIWKRLPVPVANSIGPAVRKYVTL